MASLIPKPIPDFQTYTEVEGDIATPSTDSKLKEQTADFYVSLGKDYPSGISWSVSGTGEYYSIGNYRKWASTLRLPSLT